MSHNYLKAELKNFEGGAKDFELALSKDPKLENGRINIDLSKLAQNEFQESIKDFDIIIESRDAKLDKAYFYRGEAYYELKTRCKLAATGQKPPIWAMKRQSQTLKTFADQQQNHGRKLI